MAVSVGNEMAVVTLLNRPEVNVDASTEDGETPLKLAAMQDIVESIAVQLIHHGAQVDHTGDAHKPNGKKRTPLHEATLVGSTRIMEVLLQSQAQIDAKDFEVSR